jgi:hypothetical protein
MAINQVNKVVAHPTHLEIEYNHAENYEYGVMGCSILDMAGNVVADLTPVKFQPSSQPIWDVKYFYYDNLCGGRVQAGNYRVGFGLWQFNGSYQEWVQLPNKICDLRRFSRDGSAYWTDVMIPTSAAQPTPTKNYYQLQVAYKPQFDTFFRDMNLGATLYERCKGICGFYGYDLGGVVIENNMIVFDLSSMGSPMPQLLIAAILLVIGAVIAAAAILGVYWIDLQNKEIEAGIVNNLTDAYNAILASDMPDNLKFQLLQGLNENIGTAQTDISPLGEYKDLLMLAIVGGLAIAYLKSR